MERLPLSLLAEIAIQLAGIINDAQDGSDSATTCLSGPAQSKHLTKGPLSHLNAMARSSRTCYSACNPVLYETAVAVDLERFLARKPHDYSNHIHDPTNHSTNTTAAAAAVAAGAKRSNRHETIVEEGTLPPLECTELSLAQSSSALSPQPPPPDLSATTVPLWLKKGAVVVSAAASGDIAFLDRLLFHFPSPRVRRRLLSTNTKKLLASPSCSNAHLLYIRHTYYVPLPCATHFHWRRSPCRPVNGSNPPLAAACASPLHAAACQGQNTTVAWLLDRGASIEDVALHCCQCPSPHLRFLLGHSLPRDPAYEGALPAASTASCLFFYEAPAATPLSLALAYGRQSTARLLISRGATWDRPFPMSSGVSPLHMMAAAGMVDLLRWVAMYESESEPEQECGTLASAPRHHDWPDEQGLYALHYAAAAGSRGFDIGHRASSSSTTSLTVHQAQELVDALLCLGAVYSPSIEGFRALVATERARVSACLGLGEASHPVATGARTLMQPDSSHGCRHIGYIASAEAQYRRRSWNWQLRTWLDDLDPSLADECPIAFANRIGSNGVATGITRRLANLRAASQKVNVQQIGDLVP